LIALILILLLITMVISISFYKGAEISFSPVIGFMFGCLYAYTDIEGGKEHTIQICLIFLSITIEWVET